METEAGQAAGAPGISVGSRVGDVLSGAACGAIGAMAMAGMRVLTTELGLVEQTPPEPLSVQPARGVRALLRRAPCKQRRGLLERELVSVARARGAQTSAKRGSPRGRPNTRRAVPSRASLVLCDC